KEPDNSSWLAQTASELVASNSLPSSATVGAGHATLTALLRTSRGFAPSVYRHVLVLTAAVGGTALAQRLRPFVPQAAFATLACDPLPPPTLVSTYDDAFFSGAEDVFAPAGGARLSQAATQRLLERLVPDPELRRQLQAIFEGNPAMRRQFPGGVAEFAQAAGQMPEEVLDDILMGAVMVDNAGGHEGGMPGAMPGQEGLVELEFLEGGEEEEAPAQAHVEHPVEEAVAEGGESEEEEEGEEEGEEEEEYVAPMPMPCKTAVDRELSSSRTSKLGSSTSADASSLRFSLGMGEEFCDRVRVSLSAISSIFVENGYTCMDIDLSFPPKDTNMRQTSQSLMKHFENELASHLRFATISASPFPPVIISRSAGALITQTYISSNPATGLVLISPPAANTTLNSTLLPTHLDEFDYEPRFPVALVDVCERLRMLAKTSRLGRDEEVDKLAVETFGVQAVYTKIALWLDDIGV
ncbi:hypothetical protein EVG20_g11475, partial [Dentipellis fragilis]